MNWKTDGSWFHSWHRQQIFLFKASRLALGPTQPPIQWVLGTFSPGIKVYDHLSTFLYVHLAHCWPPLTSLSIPAYIRAVPGSFITLLQVQRIGRTEVIFAYVIIEVKLSLPIS
jgi:hypothetical protein